MRYVIVGDIHGCLNTFQELMRVVKLTPSDTLILLGDLVDRGPSPVETVKHIYELTTTHKVILLRGNHEHKHLITLHYGQRFSNDDEIRSTQNQLSKEEQEWLLGGSLFYRNREENFICVHGGIPSSMTKLPWPQFNDNKGLSQENARSLMFLRRENGELWANSYDGRFGFAYFGHQVFDAPKHFNHAIGLDTGAVFGGSLSAAVIESGKKELFSVPNRETI